VARTTAGPVLTPGVRLHHHWSGHRSVVVVGRCRIWRSQCRHKFSHQVEDDNNLEVVDVLLIRFNSWGIVGDSPEGPLKQPGESCLKPEKTETKHLSPKAHARHGPHRGGPHGPPEWPSQGLPRVGSASLEGSRLPRAGPASLEGSSPPRSRPPHEHARSRTRVRAFNALTRRCSTIMRLGITPRRCYTNSLGGTHPRHCGGLCDMASVSSVALRRLLPYG
jgi:hypothetical protein